MLGERCASGGVALPSINRLIANDFHFDTVRAGECGGGRTIGGTLHVNPGIIKGAAFERRAIVQVVDTGNRFGAGGNQRLVHRHMTGGLNLQVAGGGVGIAFGGSCALLAVGQPRMQAESPRCRFVAIIAGIDGRGHAVVAEFVGDGHGHIERVSVQVGEAQRKRHGAIGQRFKLPHVVVGVSVVRIVARCGMIFVNRRAVMLAIEIVFAVFDAVWPRGQHITVTGGGQVVDAERAENFLALIIESANLGAEFADDGGIIAIVNRILISGAWCFTRHGITPVVRLVGR